MSTIPAHKIALVQLADAPHAEMDKVELSRHFRCLPGEGDFPMVAFTRTNAAARLAAQAREYERIRTLVPDFEER